MSSFLGPFSVLKSSIVPSSVHPMPSENPASTRVPRPAPGGEHGGRQRRCAVRGRRDHLPGQIGGPAYDRTGWSVCGCGVDQDIAVTEQLQAVGRRRSARSARDAQPAIARVRRDPADPHRRHWPARRAAPPPHTAPGVAARAPAPLPSARGCVHVHPPVASSAAASSAAPCGSAATNHEPPGTPGGTGPCSRSDSRVAPEREPLSSVQLLLVKNNQPNRAERIRPGRSSPIQISRRVQPAVHTRRCRSRRAPPAT